MSEAPALAINSVLLVKEEPVAEGTPTVQGPDFNAGVNLDALMNVYATMGFQATELSRAINEVNRMLKWRLSDEPMEEGDEEIADVVDRSKVKTTIFFGYTSNMISCGNREVIKFLCQHKLVDAIVTTGGGIEEDFLKCWNPHYMGDFNLKGRDLRLKGQNRIANLIVPNKNYCALEDWIMPILDQMLDEQEAAEAEHYASGKKKPKLTWTPSKLIDRLGKEIDNPDSVYYWCHKNKIPVYCPGITDGSIGDMLYFHSFRKPGLVLDVIQDVAAINDQAVQSEKTGMLILGGGIIKHHICNANLMRNGADFSVFVNTGHDWDGSDAGAPPDEAVSWGKIKLTANPIKVHCEATIAFPLIVSQTFCKELERRQQEEAAAKKA